LQVLSTLIRRNGLKSTQQNLHRASRTVGFSPTDDRDEPACNCGCRLSGHLRLRGKEDFHVKRQRCRNESSELRHWTAAACLVVDVDACHVRRQNRRRYTSHTDQVYIATHIRCYFIFTARRCASAVFGVVVLSVCRSVCHTRALWLIQRTYRRYFYTV